MDTKFLVDCLAQMKDRKSQGVFCIICMEVDGLLVQRQGMFAIQYVSTKPEVSFGFTLQFLMQFDIDRMRS
jgi:hypothetical protein